LLEKIWAAGRASSVINFFVNAGLTDGLRRVDRLRGRVVRGIYEGMKNRARWNKRRVSDE
jgi:hypothetical protein